MMGTASDVIDTQVHSVLVCRFADCCPLSTSFDAGNTTNIVRSDKLDENADSDSNRSVRSD